MRTVHGGRPVGAGPGSASGRTGPALRWTTRIVTALLAAFLVLAPSTASHATAPFQLQGGAYVVDQADALTSAQQSQVERAVQDLYDKTKTQLYVVYVPTFTDPSDHTAWGDAFRQQNQIDSDSIVLAVAVDDRIADVHQTNETALSSSDVQNAYQDDAVPRLRDGDWAAAATAFADGLAQTQDPPNLTALWVVLLVVVIAIVVVVLVIRARNKRRTAAAAKAQEESLAGLERTAGAPSSPSTTN